MYRACIVFALKNSKLPIYLYIYLFTSKQIIIRVSSVLGLKVCCIYGLSNFLTVTSARANPRETATHFIYFYGLFGRLGISTYVVNFIDPKLDVVAVSIYSGTWTLVLGKYGQGCRHVCTNILVASNHLTLYVSANQELCLFTLEAHLPTDVRW